MPLSTISRPPPADNDRPAFAHLLRHTAILLLGLSHAAVLLRAETIYLTPIADTALLQQYPSNNLGAQLYVNSGTTQIFTTNRALIKFDLAGQLPAGAQITALSLTLEVVGQPVDGDAPTTFELRRMLRDWGEGNRAVLPRNWADQPRSVKRTGRIVLR